MDALCGQIAAGHPQEAEIREELRGHMEDKFLAYMSGDERLTEEDAFLLVREHFGNPAVVEELFADVYSTGSRFFRMALTAVGCINTAFGAVGVLLGSYSFVAGLLIIQNAVRLVGPDNLLAGPYAPVLANLLGLPPACLMLVSGVGIMRRKKWARAWTLAAAVCLMVAAPLVEWVGRLGGITAPGSTGFTMAGMAYALAVILVVSRVYRRRPIPSLA